MKKFWPFIAVMILFFIDFITKYLAYTNMELYESIPLIEGFFYITYYLNNGAAFGILRGQMWLFYLVTILALGLMVYYYRMNKCRLTRFSLLLIIGGTLGNFYDRLTLQAVHDFIDFIIFGYDFPIFNFADIFLSVGIGLMILATILEGVKSNEVDSN